MHVVEERTQVSISLVGASRDLMQASQFFQCSTFIETISGFAREIPYLKSEFWDSYAGYRASDFAKFVALAQKGKAIEPHRSANEAEEQQYQKGEIERSIKYCREVLGLGRRAVV